MAESALASREAHGRAAFAAGDDSCHITYDDWMLTQRTEPANVSKKSGEINMSEEEHCDVCDSINEIEAGRMCSKCAGFVMTKELGER